MFLRTLLFAAYCAAVALLNAAVLRRLAEHAWTEVTASHVMVVPVVSLGLLVLKRRPIFASVTTGSTIGVVALVLAGCAWLAAEPSRALFQERTFLTVAVAAVVGLTVAGFVFFYGWQATRAAAFPLSFLLLTVPIPDAILAPVTGVLRDGSTELVEWLFVLSATPYVRHGYQFELPGVSIQVAEACSGIRSSIALAIAGLLAAHLFLRTTWKRVALIVLMLPIAVVKNSVRIALLALLSVHVSPTYLAGQLHREGGIVFFLFALAVALPVLLRLEHSEVGIGTAS